MLISAVSQVVGESMEPSVLEEAWQQALQRAVDSVPGSALPSGTMRQVGILQSARPQDSGSMVHPLPWGPACLLMHAAASTHGVPDTALPIGTVQQVSSDKLWLLAIAAAASRLPAACEPA